MDIELNSRSLLTVFFRHGSKFFLIFGLICLMGLVFISTRERVYEARGSFIVKFGEGGRPNVSNAVDNKEEQLNNSKEIIQSYIRIMNSTELLTSVVNAVGLKKLYPDFTEDDNQAVFENNAVRHLASNLVITTDNKSNLIEVFVRHKDARIASELANKLMEKFLARQIEVYNSPQTDFLKQQVQDIKVQLDKSQKEFLDFKNSLDISDIDLEIGQLLQEKRDISGMAFEAVTSAQTILSALEAKAAELRATYTQGSTVIKKMDQSIAEAKEQLASRKAELDAIMVPDSPLAERLNKINERLSFLEQQRGHYSELKQRVEMDENNYKYYQQRGEEARVNSVLNQENITRISVVDNPTPPLKSVPMNRLLIMIAVLMIGGFLGLVVVVFSELLDERFSTPEQLKSSFGIPVLTAFDKVEEKFSV